MFTFPVRVYYSDTDAEGIVYHTHYLDFAEHARTEMLRAAGVNQSVTQKGGIFFVVTSIQVDFKRPGHLDDQLVVQTEIEDAKVFSLVLRQTIRRDDDVLAVLHVKVASIDARTSHPAPLPKDVLEAMRAL